MKRLILAATTLGALTGCLDYDRVTMSFDTKKLRGELVYKNLVSDDPTSIDADYEELVRYRDSPQLEGEHPGWMNVSKALYEQDGQLNGRVTFEVASLADAGIYKHDRRSPSVYCSDEVVLWTNGQDISDALPGCVAWNRRTRVLQVELGDGTAAGSTSLLGNWHRETGGALRPPG